MQMLCCACKCKCTARGGELSAPQRGRAAGRGGGCGQRSLGDRRGQRSGAQRAGRSA